MNDYILPINKSNSLYKRLGISLPFNGKTVFNSTYTNKDKIKKSIYNFILTSPGERPYMPNYGLGLYHYLFENIYNDFEGGLKNLIIEKLGINFPKVTFGKIDVEVKKDYYIYLTLTYIYNFIEDDLKILIEK